MNTIDKQAVLRAGRTLSRVWSDPAIETAIEILRLDFTQRIVQTEYADKDGRERLYRQYHALSELEGIINTLIATANTQLMAEDDN